MAKLVIFEIGEGSFEHGFRVIIKVGEDGQPHSAEITSEQFPTFPPAPDIPNLYKNWQNIYRRLGHVQRIIIPQSQITNVSTREECNNAANALVASINHWLNQPSARKLERLLLQKVSELEEVRFIIKTQNPIMRRLPWHLWDFFQTCFPQAEIALSTDYQPSSRNLKNPIRILALVGHSQGINTQEDLNTLNKLPDAKVEILQEPSKRELINKLRSQAWDILFFAGHSFSQEGDYSGEIQINEQETLSLQSLRNTLKYAVQKGLKLAFFNSCDGLGLANSLADLKIPYIVVMREPIPDHVAQNFLQYFLTAFASGEPFYSSVRQARERIQEELEDEYPCASWLPVVFQNPAVAELTWPNDHEPNRKLWFLLGGAIALISLGFGIGKLAREINFYNRTSYGEEILVKTIKTPEKEAGVQAYWWRDYQTAAAKFALSLEKNRNDPETLIYKNNAQIGNRKSLTIVVSVPITSNVNVAQEILRGVAQAQDEVNSLGGINSKFIKVKIADDSNDPQIAKELASRFVDESEILAVLGHNASNASVAAAPEYENGKLVMMTATSFSSKLSQTGKYIFRTVPEVIYFADVLVEYIAENQGHKNIAICIDSQSQDNISFSSQLEATFINKYKGNMVNINCDVAEDNFNPEQAINTAISKKVTAIVLSPHIDRIDKALLVAKANKGRLKLFGSPTLYTYQTLEMGQSAVNGLVLSVPWHPEAFPNHPFVEKARKMWGGNVTWRTAFSYDAMKTLILGLRNSQPQESREKLRAALRADDFKVYGPTGEVNFRPSGDRKLNSEPIIVEVQQRQNSRSGYDFVVIKNKKSVDN